MTKDRSKGGTPATVFLQAAGVPYVLHEFEHGASEGGFGLAAAAALGVEPDRVFKTLVATVEGLVPPSLAVAIVPVNVQLALKELAIAVGGKRAEMCEPTVAQRVTGYVVGGISPFGQKRRLPTAIDETCELFDTIFVSGGRRGWDIEIAPGDLIRQLDAVTAPIAAGRPRGA